MFVMILTSIWVLPGHQWWYWFQHIGIRYWMICEDMHAGTCTCNSGCKRGRKWSLLQNCHWVTLHMFIGKLLHERFGNIVPSWKWLWLYCKQSPMQHKLWTILFTFTMWKQFETTKLRHTHEFNFQINSLVGDTVKSWCPKPSLAYQSIKIATELQ